MDTVLKTSIWQQFGAAIDTLSDAINLCPEALWSVTVWDDQDDARYGQFWWVAYHALVWLDLFRDGSYETFVPPAPFVRGKFPQEPYTKAEILDYLAACRQKCHDTIFALTDEQAYAVHKFEWMEPTYVELQLYSMRHIQEHAAQLNLVLGQHGVTGQDWVPKARD